MTVETQSAGEPVVRSGPYDGNGVSDTFDYDFQIQSESEILVTRQNASGDEVVLVLTTDYTVTGVGDDTGGQVVLVDPANDLPTGAKLVLQYDGDYNQSTDYSNQGAIALGDLEDALDKVMMHLRSLKEQIDRSIKAATFDADGVTFQLPAPLANAAVGWNAAADALTNLTSIASSTVSGTVDGAVMRYDATGGGIEESALYVKDNGHVGVGTTNPSDIFQINDNAPTMRFVDLENGVFNEYALIYYDVADDGAFYIDIDPANQTANSKLRLKIGSSIPYTFSESGTFSIDLAVAHQGDGNNRLQFGTGTQTYTTSAGSTAIDLSDDGLRVGGAGARATTIKAAGTVGTSDTKLVTEGHVYAMTPRPLLAEVSVDSVVSSIPFTSVLDDTLYDGYEVHIFSLALETSGEDLHLEVSNDNGATWETTNYEYITEEHTVGAAETITESASDSKCILATDLRDPAGLGASQLFTATLLLYAGDALNDMSYTMHGTTKKAAGGQARVHSAGNRSNNITAFRLRSSSGGIESGIVKVYGIRKANFT